MNRIPLRRFDALMSLRRTMIQYAVPTCANRRLLSDSSAAATSAAAAAPADADAATDQRRWVMLSRRGVRTGQSFVANTKTVAEARTSTGRHLRVSLICAAPPASSKLCFNFPQEGGNDHAYFNVAAAHGELLLLEVGRRRGLSVPEDHFVYTPAGAARPPSLSLLPVRDFQTKFESIIALGRNMVQPPNTDTTGLLRRRGENGVLVVQVQFWFDGAVPRDQRRLMAELCVLRPGMRQWELMKPVPILYDQGDEELILKSPNYVVIVGDRFLCWVHDHDSSGFVLCDMADEGSPKARFVPFPDEVRCSSDAEGDDDDDSRCDNEDSDCDDDSDEGDDSDDSSDSSWDGENDNDEPIGTRYMGAADDRNVRLVSIDPHGFSGFTINTWMMNLSTDEPSAWVKDGEMDSKELWDLPGYEGLPRLRQENLQSTHVFLDSDNPDVVGLLVCNDYNNRDEKVWMIRLNMKTKTLLSAVQSLTKDPWMAFYHLPVQLWY